MVGCGPTDFAAQPGFCSIELSVPLLPDPHALLAHTSPLTREHIGFSGDFLWEPAAARAGMRRPLNLRPSDAAA